MAEVLAIDGVDPHVVVVGVDHEVEHMVAVDVSEKFESFPHSFSMRISHLLKPCISRSSMCLAPAALLFVQVVHHHCSSRFDHTYKLYQFYTSPTQAPSSVLSSRTVCDRYDGSLRTFPGTVPLECALAY
jgi:hypothetical protein